MTQHRAHLPGASVASSELNKLDHYGDRLALYTEIIKMALYINTINKIALKNHHHIEEKSIPTIDSFSNYLKHL